MLEPEERDEFEDIEDEIDEPIPAKRDIKIFQRKKEEEKEEEFEEDVFV